MNPRQIIVIMLALAAAAIALFVVRGMMAKPQQPAAPQVVAAPPGPKVLAAVEPIQIGEIVQDKDLDWVEISKDAAKLAGDGLLLQGAVEKQEYVGRVAKVGIAKGELIFQDRLVAVGDRSFMTALLEPGYRAISVPINPESAVAGFILPNDHVDVILTARVNLQGSDDGESVVRSDVILADVKVLAVDQTVSAQVDENGKTSTVNGAVATFALSPRDAETLAMAKQLGTLSLALRGLREGQPAQVASTVRPGARALQQSVNVNSVVLLHNGGQAAPTTVRGH